MESGSGVEPSQPLTEQETTLKRNTDCVYFLASPLSCKKGSECEYRHNNGVRFNPMDCWFWLNGNCLNANCCYRHPPLDWTFEDPWAIPMPFEPPSSLSSVLSTKVQVAYGPDSHNISKPNVPCYFFQKGNCLKGGKCHFMHGTQPTDASTAQQFIALASSSSELLSGIPRGKWVPKERSRESTPKENATEVVEFLPSAKSITRAENVPNNGLVTVKSEYLHSFDDELPQFQSRNLPLNHCRDYQFSSIYQHLQNGKDAEEFFRQSSPGFDVLVDDPMEVSDYFKTEDKYGGRNLNYIDDFNYHHPDYDEIPRLETGQHRQIRQYGMNGNLHGHEQCRTTIERVLERSSMIEKRKLRESYSGLDRFDLRHKLLKLSRENGSGSDKNSVHHGNPRKGNLYTNEDKSRAQHFQRYHRSLPREKTSISRLKSRMSLITRSPDQHMNLQSSVDTNRERYRRKSSRDRMVSDQWRFHPRMERRVIEDLISCDKKTGLQTVRKDDAASSDFPGPKSLAEIKGTKVTDHVENNESEMNHGVRGPQ